MGWIRNKVLLIVALAFVIRFYVFVDTLSDYCCASDAGTYHSIATHLAKEGKFIYTIDDDWDNWTEVIYGAKPPLYPFFLAGVYKMHSSIFFLDRVFSKNYNLAIFVQIMLSIVTGLLIYWVTKDVFSEKVAMIALMIYAFFWEIIQMNVWLLSENLFWFLTMTLVYMLFKYRKKQTLMLILLGLNLALLILLRPPSILAAIMVAVYLLAKDFSSKSLVKIAVVFLFMAMMILPWILRNYRIYGRFVFIYTDGGINLWMGNYEKSGGTYNIPKPADENQTPILMAEGPAAEIERDNFYFRKAVDYIKANPWEVLNTDVKKIFLTFSTYRPWMLNTASDGREWFLGRPRSEGIIAFYEFVISYEYVALILSFFLGLVISIGYWKKHKEKLGMLYFLLAMNLGVIGLTHTEPRYVTQLYVLMIPFSALAVERLMRNFAKSSPDSMA